MPTAAQILRNLTEISNQAIAVAVVWHLLLAAALVALTWGWKPKPGRFAALSALPVVSVSVAAVAYGNFFNGATFAALTLALGLAAWSAGGEAPEPPPRWATWLGGLLIAFGWTYPHFLEGHSALAYLMAAPLGLVPCPTLSLLAGFALLGYRPTGRAWPLVVAAAGIFYGLFGLFRLGVTIDAVLLVGALALGAHALAPRSAAPLPGGPAQLGHGV
jgi:hypothetical protein